MEEPVVEVANNLSEPVETPTSCTHFAQGVCSHHFHSYTQIKPLTSSTLVYKEECVYCFSKWVQPSLSFIFIS